MMSHDTNYGYKKILGLRGDRQTGQKRSLEAQADAFSRLKKYYSERLVDKSFVPGTKQPSVLY